MNVTNCDQTGSGCVAPELCARWEKRPELMSRRRSKYFVNLEGLLTRQMLWNTRGHKFSGYAGELRSLQVNLVSPGLTGRMQRSSSAAGEQRDRRADPPTSRFLEGPHRSPRGEHADGQHRPQCHLARKGTCRETEGICSTTVGGQPSSPAQRTSMTAAKGLRPPHPGGHDSRDLRQALTAGLIQDIYVPGWLRRWEQVLTFRLAADRIRSGFADERIPSSPLVLRVYSLIGHRFTFSAAPVGSIPSGALRDK
jgi:hypothetical protein